MAVEERLARRTAVAEVEEHVEADEMDAKGQILVSVLAVPKDELHTLAVQRNKGSVECEVSELPAKVHRTRKLLTGGSASPCTSVESCLVGVGRAGKAGGGADDIALWREPRSARSEAATLLLRF